MRCLAAKLRPFDPGVDLAMPSTRSSLPEIRPDLAAGGPAGIWRSHPIENEQTARGASTRPSPASFASVLKNPAHRPARLSLPTVGTRREKKPVGNYAEP